MKRHFLVFFFLFLTLSSLFYPSSSPNIKVFNSFSNIYSIGSEHFFTYSSSFNLSVNMQGTLLHYDFFYSKLTSDFTKLSFSSSLISANIGFDKSKYGVHFMFTAPTIKDFSYLYKKGTYVKSGDSGAKGYYKNRIEFSQKESKTFLFSIKVPIFFSNDYDFSLTPSLSYGKGEAGKGDMYYFYGKFFSKDIVDSSLSFIYKDLKLRALYSYFTLSLSNNLDTNMGDSFFHLFTFNAQYDFTFRSKRRKNLSFTLTPLIKTFLLIGDVNATLNNKTQDYIFFPYKHFNVNAQVDLQLYTIGLSFITNISSSKVLLNALYLFTPSVHFSYDASYLYKKNAFFSGESGNYKGNFYTEDLSFNNVLFFTIDYQYCHNFLKRGYKNRKFSFNISKTFFIPFPNPSYKEKKAGGGGGGGSVSAVDKDLVLSYLLSMFSLYIEAKL